MKRLVLSAVIAFMCTVTFAQKKLVALSYDDGPNTTTTVQMLDMLKKHNVKASFFVIGNNINEESAKVMQRAHNEGHDIENHSRTHSAMPTLSDDAIKAEIEYTSSLVEKYVGERPQFFRPPYIAVDRLMYDTIELPFICGEGCEDWVAEVTAKQRYERMLASARDGLIFLLHDFEGNDNTVKAVDKLIPALKKRGYEFVTVRELFKRKNITPAHGVMYTDILNSEPVEKTVFKNDDVEFRQLDEHTWHGFGHLVYNESVYLIEGEESALLIDAGTRIPNLRKIAEDIVKKPVTLVISHAHGDHTGEINQWDSLWLNAADMAIVPDGAYNGKIQYLTDGQVFDLGGREIEVIFTPGHTPGSATFVDKKAHYGFSSDAFGSGNLLVFTDLSTQIASCQRMQRFLEKYGIKYLYPGHYWGNNLETPQRVKDIATICEGILNGTLSPIPGNNKSLPFIVDKYGVKVNYGNNQIR